MALPVAFGWLAGVLAKFAQKPLLAALTSFGVALVGLLTGLLQDFVLVLVNAVLSLLGAVWGETDLPDPPAWVATFGAPAVAVLQHFHLHTAIGVIVGGLFTRMALWAVTLGRF